MKNFFKKISIGILLAVFLIGASYATAAVTYKVPTPIALYEDSLANAITSSATSFTLVRGTDIVGTSLAASTYGFIIDEGSSSQEFVLADCTATACTNAIRGVSPITGLTAVTSLQKTHRRGAVVKMTDAPILLILKRLINGDETIPNILSYVSHPTFSSNTQIVDKQYVDESTSAGCGNADTTSKGCVEIATQAEVDAGTQLGSTGAYLSTNPALTRAKGYHDYAADAVGTDSYAITITPAITAYATGQHFTFKAATANTGAATLNVSAIGAKTIKKNTVSDLETGDIVANQIVNVVYDGTYMQMTSVSPLISSNYSKTADVQVYTADATWTKPTGAKMIEVITIGAGGSGAAGITKPTNGTQVSGGTGGGGGSIVRKLLRASDLTSTVAVTVAPTSSGAGASSSFGTYVVAYGGGEGRLGSDANSSGGSGGGTGSVGENGSNSADSTGGLPASTAGASGISGQGAGGVQGASGKNAEFGGASGGGSTTSSAGATGGSSLFGGAAGGGGGGVNGGTPGTSANGAAGGAYGSYVVAGGGAAGTGSGGAGTSGTSRSGYGLGDGGGGGAGSGIGAGGAGGAGGAPGGGGGGGGSVAVGQTAGAGGAGGRGEVRVITYY